MTSVLPAVGLNSKSNLYPRKFRCNSNSRIGVRNSAIIIVALSIISGSFSPEIAESKSEPISLVKSYSVHPDSLFSNYSVVSLSFSKNGKYLGVILSDTHKSDRKYIVWNVKERKIQSSLPPCPAGIISDYTKMIWGRNDQIVSPGQSCGNAVVGFYDPITSALIKKIDFFTLYSTVSVDGNQVALIGYQDGNEVVQILSFIDWNYKFYRSYNCFGSHSSILTAIWTNNKNILLSGYFAPYNTPECKESRDLIMHRGYVSLIDVDGLNMKQYKSWPAKPIFPIQHESKLSSEYLSKLKFFSPENAVISLNRESSYIGSGVIIRNLDLNIVNFAQKDSEENIHFPGGEAAFDVTGNYLFVQNVHDLGDSSWIVDSSMGKKVGKFPGGNGGRGLSISRDGNWMALANGSNIDFYKVNLASPLKHN